MKQSKSTFTLNAQGVALLELLADPTDFRSKQAKAAEVGLSESHACRLSRKPEFIKLMHERVREIVKSELPEAYKALLDSAKIPGKEGAADRRTLFQVVGDIATGGSQISITQINGGEVDNDFESRTIKAREAVVAGIAAAKDES